MTKIISVNAGSSSLKFQLFEMPSEEVLTSGIAERIGLEEGIFTIKYNGEKHTQNLPIKDHKVAVDLLLIALVEHKIVENLEEIKGAGHRIVQGGSYFDSSAVVDEDVVNKVEELSDLAPLHNPAHLIGYRAFKEALPQIGHVFVFDTAFHQTMTPESYLFPVPMEWYENYKVRRYGAHGTSHQYVSQRCAELMGKDVKNLKIITCHLGNGASITAVDGGKCINTSMGLTPLGGIMMGTRCGDIDPAIVPFVMKKTGMTPDEMDTALNKKSGMLGISGISSDARDIENAVAEGNERAILTQQLYVNRAINVIGGYYFQLGGCDAIVFTAGLGENDCNLRHQICEKLEKAMDLKMNYELNDKTRGKEVCVSADDSKVQVWVVPTNEELVIARDTYSLLGF
ncbi:acetate/propionate family kinase [Dielma fastidiosa]|uniref:acetate/propionate family kinase n=1 Tax=Dielma fastidiosa TaxID=1034346 RepID=UPI00356A9074